MENQEKKPFNQIEYENQYNREHYDRVTVLLPKGQREMLKAHAQAKGMSTNAWLLQAIKNAIDQGL